MKLRNRTKKNFKSKVKKLKIIMQTTDFTTKNFNVELSSYKGLLKYRSCKSLYYKTISFIKKQYFQFKYLYYV